MHPLKCLANLEIQNTVLTATLVVNGNKKTLGIWKEIACEPGALICKLAALKSP